MTTRHLTLSDGGAVAPRRAIVRDRADGAVAAALARCAMRAPGRKSRRTAKATGGERAVAPRLFAVVEELGERGQILEAADRAALRDAVTELGDTIAAQLVAVLDVALGGRPSPTPPATPALRRVA